MDKGMVLYALHDRLAIFGGSGHGNVVADIAHLTNEYQEVEFFDDDLSKNVIGDLEQLIVRLDEYDVIVAIGNNRIRKMIQEKIVEAGGNVVSLIHPMTSIGENIEVGRGTVLMAGAVINHGSKIGNSVIINTAASVDHDNEISDYVHISVGAHTCGTVKVGENCFLGAGSIVINNTEICDDVTLGAGTVVTQDITDSGIYVGTPARKIKEVQ